MRRVFLAAPTRPLTLVPRHPPPQFFFLSYSFLLFFSLLPTDSTAPVWRSEGRNGLKTFGASFWFRWTTCFIQETRLPVTTHLSVEHAARPSRLFSPSESLLSVQPSGLSLGIKPFEMSLLSSS